MKTLLTLFTLSAVLCSGLFAQSPEDRAAGVMHLETTLKGVNDAVQGLSDAQLNFKPAPDRWSVAQVLEHLASAEAMLFGLVQDQAMKAPPRAEDDQADVKETDRLILTAIPDRTQKRSAPEPLIPTNRYGSSAEALRRFNESRAKTLALMQDGKGLRDHAMDSPLGRKLDPYQWLLFISAHTERHTKQMIEVKSDAGFPQL